MVYAPLPVATISVVVAAAAVLDLLERRIPNPLSAVLLAAGAAAQLCAAGLRGVLSGGAATVLMVLLLWPFWQKRGIGGGDVKLAAAAAMSVGLGRLVLFLSVTALAGGLVALATYAAASPTARARVRQHLGWALVTRRLPEARVEATRASVPYGVAIAVGALAALWPGV